MENVSSGEGNLYWKKHVKVQFFKVGLQSMSKSMQKCRNFSCYSDFEEDDEKKDAHLQEFSLISEIT
ncbi:hypothetical protein FHR92_000713 [Fontibacillus solani]|uniref:Uncharacterized protein n=1 Tax=Fontibacillus solani TaxID=1572857 RepID=A0A7W3XQ97_9BACL|nr:hypothetical protein [Fontibacillus solani]MBA9084259.1 hypothetical protein [Fontibacillus solani]